MPVKPRTIRLDDDAYEYLKGLAGETVNDAVHALMTGVIADVIPPVIADAPVIADLARALEPLHDRLIAMTVALNQVLTIVSETARGQDAQFDQAVEIADEMDANSVRLSPEIAEQMDEWGKLTGETREDLLVLMWGFFTAGDDKAAAAGAP